MVRESVLQGGRSSTLDSLAGSASFSSQQINVLKSLGEPDDAGNIYFDRVLSDGFACLQGLQQVTIMRG